MGVCAKPRIVLSIFTLSNWSTLPRARYTDVQSHASLICFSPSSHTHCVTTVVHSSVVEPCILPQAIRNIIFEPYDMRKGDLRSDTDISIRNSPGHLGRVAVLAENYSDVAHRAAYNELYSHTYCCNEAGMCDILAVACY